MNILQFNIFIYIFLSYIHLFFIFVIYMQEQSKFKLICLCSCHISCVIKIKWMDEMIESWKNQTHNIDLHINISLEDNIKTIFEHYKNSKWNCNNLFFYIQEQKLSQFEHYKNLCDRIISIFGNDVWVIFTDDDDIWEKDRALYYNILINKLYEQNKENEISHIQIPTLCVNYKDSFDNNYKVKNLKNIDDCNEYCKDNLDYWQFCCKIKYLKDYTEKCHPDLLKDGFCNLYFVKYFYNGKTQAFRWYTKDEKRFVYYWRGNGGKKINKDDSNNIHLLDNLKKNPEKMLIKMFFMKVKLNLNLNNSISDKKKIRKKLEKYAQNYGKELNCDSVILKNEIQKVFDNNNKEYEIFLNSPILENIIT
jgi:hypothetical protein